MSKARIAVVQFEIKENIPDRNIKRAEEFVKKASKEKANIVVFPENFLSHPHIGKRDFMDSKQKCRKAFQKIAKKYKIDIVCGSVIEKDQTGAHYNTTYYIDSNGRVRGKYRKINLWHTEKPSIIPGNQIRVFDTKYGKIGLIICWDLIFPEIFRKMGKKGVEIIICPSHWCYGDAGKGLKYDKNSEIKLVNSLCVDRAFENEIILVFCNTAGKIKFKKSTDVSIGHSQITEPFKGAVKKITHNKEGMLIVDTDTGILRDAEVSYKIKKDLERLRNLKIKIEDVMRKVIVSDANITGKDAVKIMSNKGIGSLIIVKRNKIAGIVTERDVLRNVNKLNDKISSIMSKNVATINKNESLDNLIAIMAKKRIKRIPITDRGKPVGIVTATDLIANSDQFIDLFT